MTPKPRKCRHFIESFQDWVRPRSQAPDSCLMWTALFTISAAVRKHVRIPPEEGLAGWACYPNLYVVLVGEPGVINKSTTMNFGDKLLRALPEIPASPTEISKAALIAEMCDSPDGSLYITAGELSQVISRSKMDMYDYLTVCYDTDKPLRGRTIMNGKVEIPEPCLNLFACTQPVWIIENMPAAVIGGGFTSRAIMLYEKEPRTVELFRPDLNHKAFDKIQEDLIEDLVTISNLNGSFKVPREVQEYMNDWYRKTHLERVKIHPNIKPFFARRHVHVLKIAMLFNIAYSNDLVLSKIDCDFAIGQFKYALSKVEGLFKSIGKNEYTGDTTNIVEYIRLNKEVPRTQLFREFESVAVPNKIQELLDGLVLMEIIEVTRDGADNLTYKFID